LADENAPLSRVVGGKLVLNTACITEEERLETNLENSDFRWDYDDRLDQDNINKTFVYALLGETINKKTLALVLAPVGDGTFMRIGIFFNFKLQNWKPESLERKNITII
jgi:hypothetical protein